MKTSWHDIWGSADGPVGRLAPQARIVCGTCVFAVCMIAPATTAFGISAVLSATVLWVIICRPPVTVVRDSIVFGFALFLPYSLLVPLIYLGKEGGGWLDAFSPAWTIFFRGLSSMLVSITTVTTLSASELRQGLIHLPLPNSISAILVQIVHQASALIYETRRIASATAVRSGSYGFRTALRVVVSLPTVWMPRIIDKTERVAKAMEMRGYCQQDLRALGGVSTRPIDAYAMALSALLVIGAVAIRLWRSW
jgi:energy-coupling factor transporter transmembrane protein EcfT